MNSTMSVRVKWNARITSGEYSAIAEEAMAGYQKGDVIAIVSRIKHPDKLPTVMAVLPKKEHHEI